MSESGGGLSIPAGLEALTPQWLTGALRRSRVLSDATVVGVAAEPLGEGGAFTGRLARLRLALDPADAPAPRTLVAKLTAADPAVRAFCLPLCSRELGFYRDVAADVPVAAPRLYHGALDAESGLGVLLLEDLGRCAFCDCLAGCAPAEAALALRELARLHAAWWEHPRLAALPWLPAHLADPAIAHQAHRRAWPVFAARLGARLPAAFRRLGERLLAEPAAFAALFGPGVGPPHTLQHGDFRVDNLAFGRGPGDAPLYVLDWQTARRGRGAFDATWLVANSLLVAARRAHEAALLDAYHAALAAVGVRDYPRDRFARDCRVALAQVMAQLVIAGANLTFDAAWYAAIAERQAAMAEDHGLDRLLDEAATGA
jgi:hypothetical protein